MNIITHIFDGGSGLSLSPRATTLARYLMDHPNTIHQRDSLAEACDIMHGGRAIDTYIAEIRKALGARDVIACQHGRGYAWIGDPVDLVPCVSSKERATPNKAMANAAVMTRDEVAKRLGLTVAAVGLIESRALAKLRKHQEILDAWRSMLATRKRYTYDPFQEAWLFSVQGEYPYEL